MAGIADIVNRRPGMTYVAEMPPGYVAGLQDDGFGGKVLVAQAQGRPTMVWSDRQAAWIALPQGVYEVLVS